MLDLALEWTSTYRCNRVMNVARPPQLRKHNSENWKELTAENGRVRGQHVIVDERLDVWIGRVRRIAYMIAPNPNPGS